MLRTARGTNDRTVRTFRPFRRPQSLLVAAILCGLPGVLHSQGGNTAGRGLTVEEVGHGSGGDRAGIRTGDVLIAWARGTAKGNIESPFDLDVVEQGEAPRGEV